MTESRLNAINHLAYALFSQGTAWTPGKAEDRDFVRALVMPAIDAIIAAAVEQAKAESAAMKNEGPVDWYESAKLHAEQSERLCAKLTAMTAERDSLRLRHSNQAQSIGELITEWNALSAERDALADKCERVQAAYEQACADNAPLQRVVDAALRSLPRPGVIAFTSRRLSDLANALKALEAADD